MLFHFRTQFPSLNPFWDKYLPYQELTGSGLGAWSKEQVGLFFSEIMPEMYALAAEGRLKTDTISVKLENIASLWNLDVPGGKRLVVTI